MRKSKWILTTVASIVLATTVSLTGHASIATAKTMQDESIYDVLVDRFFNSQPTNDFDVNGKDLNAFAGGDFAGITTKASYFDDLGFTILSIGSIFEADDFRSAEVIDYSKLQKRFGTDKEYEEMRERLHKSKIAVMTDFPINGVSAKNKLQGSKDWSTTNKDGTIDWKLDNVAVQNALIAAASDFVTKYKVDGLRLTNSQKVDDEVLNRIIAELKAQHKNLWIISNEPSNAHFDINYDDTSIEYNQQIFKNNDLDSSQFLAAKKGQKTDLPTTRMIDHFSSPRFTHFSAEENMYPPTRVKMAMGANLLLPGVPIMSYGTEIAMNGAKQPENLQSMDFRTKDDIIKYIGQMQSLRNGSVTLRNGDFKLIENKNGFIVFERFSKDEKWFIVINNTSKTKTINLTEKQVGTNKELHGRFENDIVRMNDNNEYRIGLDREIVEVYQVMDNKGFNKPYLIALALVYILFVGFIVVVLKRGKKRKNKE
ncbi:alpha-amylase family glycosyl hydrolase [Kurthia sibirica]|uniref:Alpha-amlyase n=1 Tax=Kurthia sibirica TaxID=202750 RepID=A0A2U3AMR9_9BACL|nr:alpha-amylase family glycosyl hydrolase [Kurthia sibirica]PWI25834.1 alpha-amlyase [Kurthia sibirica]GEK33653.1 alpha-amylase [Kurthia sibirica]